VTDVSEAQDAPQSQSIVTRLELEHSPAKVWRALTQPELLAQWLLPVEGNALELRVGEEFTYRTQPHPGWDGTVNCRLLRIEPERELVYAWTVPFLDTVVTFTLVPTDAGTQLTIVQAGFQPDQKRESGGARYGWTMMTGRLVELLGRIE